MKGRRSTSYHPLRCGAAEIPWSLLFADRVAAFHYDAVLAPIRRDENVVAIKIAPFNRYATLDVVKGVVAARAEERVALYNRNDDHIVLDLAVRSIAARERDGAGADKGRAARPWSVWTKTAVAAAQQNPRREN